MWGVIQIAHHPGPWDTQVIRILGGKSGQFISPPLPSGSRAGVAGVVSSKQPKVVIRAWVQGGLRRVVGWNVWDVWRGQVGGGGGYIAGGRGGVLGCRDCNGLDWCFVLFGRAIPGSQVTRPTRPVTLTRQRPVYARGPKGGVPYSPTRHSPLPRTHEGHNSIPT